MSRAPVRVVLAVALVAGAYGAIVLSRGGSGAADRGAFFADVARRINVDPRALGAALRGGEPRPTVVEAPRRFDTRTFRFRGRSLSIDATARYLGVTEGEVREELRLGGSLADVARRHGGSVDGLQEAIEDEVSRRLQGLSEAERLRIAERLDEILRRDGRPAGWSGRGGP
jgi:hypothetical protein